MEINIHTACVGRKNFNNLPQPSESPNMLGILASSNRNSEHQHKHNKPTLGKPFNNNHGQSRCVSDAFLRLEHTRPVVTSQTSVQGTTALGGSRGPGPW